jgi:hypothetical protein
LCLFLDGYIHTLVLTSDGTGDLSIIEASRVRRVLGLIAYEPTANDPVFIALRAVNGDITLKEFKLFLKANKESFDESLYLELIQKVDVQLDIFVDPNAVLEVNNSKPITSLNPEEIAGRTFFILHDVNLISKVVVDNSGKNVKLYTPQFIQNIKSADDEKLLEEVGLFSDVSASVFKASLVPSESRYAIINNIEVQDFPRVLWFYDYDAMLAYAKSYAFDLNDELPLNKKSISGKEFNIIFNEKSDGYDQMAQLYDDNTFSATLTKNETESCRISNGIWGFGFANSLIMAGEMFCGEIRVDNLQVYALVKKVGNDIESLSALNEEVVELTYMGVVQK